MGVPDRLWRHRTAAGVVAVAVAVIGCLVVRRRRAQRRLGGELSPGPAQTLAPNPTGRGLYVLVNPEAGPALSTSPTEALIDALPEATVRELIPDDDLRTMLREATDDGACAIGIAGGDGSINTAGQVALVSGLPLMVVPAGTLNHLTRDLGVPSVDEAVAAVRDGSAVTMTVGCIGERPFLNTASIGGYVELVDAREQLERYIGKWPAVLLALVRVLRRSDPVDVELDGRRRRLWLIFIGNGGYHPQGFVPSRRARLDSNELDVRLVDGSEPFARTRLLLAVVTGTLSRTAAYEEFRTRRMTVRSLDGPLRLAVDGETFDTTDGVVVCKHDDRLTVYTPLAGITSA